jgi:ribosome-binding protein aMBF1 (putative translation factor)
MGNKKVATRLRRQGPDPQQTERLEEIRKKVKEEFPPREPPRLKPATTGIAAQIRTAREAQGLTWYAVAKRAGIPNPNTVRDVEYGRDVKLSNLQAVASALGLRLELVHVE